MIRLGSTAARLKLKGIDGGPYKRWSMWFNLIILVESYRSMNKFLSASLQNFSLE